jgi:hypothetical protein
MEGLAVAIQQGAVHFPDGPIVSELNAFEYEYTRTGVRYGAPHGMHDDCVCALALAVMRWNEWRRTVHTTGIVPIGIERGRRQFDGVYNPFAILR